MLIVDQQINIKLSLDFSLHIGKIIYTSVISSLEFDLLAQSHNQPGVRVWNLKASNEVGSVFCEILSR